MQNGLYAAAAGAILYAVFGTSRQISTGPSSGLAAVAASAVVAAKITGTQDVASFVATITLASGVLFLLLAVFKMGWIAQFLSRAVVTGFLFGAAIDVVIGELPKLTGTDVTGSNPLQELRSWFGTLSEASLVTVLVGGVVARRGLRIASDSAARSLERWCWWSGASWPHGSSTSAPTGSPWWARCRGGCRARSFPSGSWSATTPARSPWRRWRWCSSGSPRPPATPGRSRPSTAIASTSTKNRWPRGWPTSAPACSRACPSPRACPPAPSTTIPAPASGLASLTSGVIVLLTLLVLAPLFSKLPKPVLAALIIEAVVMGMMDVPEMRRLAKVQRFDFWIAMAAIAGTLVFGVLAGVMIGIGLSLLWLISVATRPPMPLLGREPGTQVFRELDEHPADEQFPGVVVLRLDGGLFFATSDALEDRVREVALSTPGITGIVLDCEGIDFIDSQGSAKMGEILELTQQAGVTLRLARVKPAVQELLDRDGFLDRIGPGQDPRKCLSGRRGPDGYGRDARSCHLKELLLCDVWAQANLCTFARAFAHIPPVFAIALNRHRMKVDARMSCPPLQATG